MLGNPGNRLRSLLYIALLSGVAWLISPTQVVAQQGSERLIITSTESGNPPVIILRAYALNAQGGVLELNPDNVIINHNGEPVGDIEFVGDYQAGTFTLFVVDVPGGLESYLEPIQQSIEQYASPPFMEERADYIGLYRVGGSGPDELLTPTNFYNAIRNFFFSTPLQSTSEQTALADSMGSLLNEISALKPKADMAASIVLITDGTDAVSEQFQLEDIGALASEKGIPIHTIWLENEQLLGITQEEGRSYLAQLAAETGGISAMMSQPENLASIWERITSFRNHQVLQYQPENIQGGMNEVTLSLVDSPEVVDSTTISISETAPSIEIILPPESREISLENLEKPVKLSLATSVSWLDNIDRMVTSAELLVNRIPAGQIDVEELGRFTAEINYFSYGPNDIQVKIEDELGQTATSPVVTLQVTEGENSLPEAIRPSGISDSPFFRIGLLCLAVFLIIAIGAVVVLVLRSIGFRGRIGRSRGRRGKPSDPSTTGKTSAADVEMQASDFPSVSYQGAEVAGPTRGQRVPYLEVLSSVTRMPPTITLTAVEHHIGRSPHQADIVLENDITVSRLHASIILEGSDYRIYDEGSSSGTWVNGQEVPEYGYQLIDGDEIRLGETWLRYRR